MKASENELPWYLKDKAFFIIAFCFAPAAYIIILWKWKSVDDETKRDRFFIASIFLLLFTIGLMPRSYLSLSLAIGVIIFLCAATVAVMLKQK